MKNMSKILLLFLVFSLSFALVGAYTVTTDNTPADTSGYPMDNFLGRLFSSLGYSGEFTGYGKALECTEFPVETTVFTRDTTLLKIIQFTPLRSILTSTETVVIRADDNEVIMVNWFRGSPEDGYYEDHPTTAKSRQFMGEIFLENVDTIDGEKSIKLTCDARAYWNNLCYYEIYRCPKPCFTISDCFSGQTCDKTILSQITETTPLYFPENAGKCIAEEKDWKTQVYRCSDGEKINLGKVDSTNLNFCDEGEIKYLIGTTDQCLDYEPESCYKTDAEVIEEKEEETTLPPQVGVEKDKLSSMPTSQMVLSVCSSSSNIGNLNCETGSSCIVISKLLTDDDITESQADVLRKSFCDAAVGNIGVFSNALKLAISSFDASYKKSCVNALNKDSYFQQNYGICIIDSDEFNLEKITGWAAFFDITGDKGVDGLIIIFGSIIFLVILFSISGGRRR
jgi:hypothetical protein